MKYLVTNNNPASLRNLGLASEFDRMLDSIFSDLPGWDSRFPAVDIVKEEGQYVLSADLPGYQEDKIEIKVDGNLLTISAQVEEQKEESGKKYLVKERVSSSFKRSFALPKDVDTDKIEAAFKDGVLILTMKQSEKAQAKTINIKSN